MSLVCKLFISSESVSPSGASKFTLGAVCRGEENKHWAAATPAGSLETPSNEVLTEVWRKRQAGEIVNPEVFVYTQPDPAGTWKLMKCEFAYGGVMVEFRREGAPPDYLWGKFSMTVNNSGATRVLREMFARSLTDGQPATFSLTYEEATAESGPYPERLAQTEHQRGLREPASS